MDANEYQKKALETVLFDENDLQFSMMYCALGLNGEAGEVAEKVKKIFRDFNGNISVEKAEAIAYECGDVIWYVAMLARLVGYDLGTVLRMNNQKLADRMKRGKVKGSGDSR